jgi:hypothetical protein
VYPVRYAHYLYAKSKAISVTGRGGLQSSEMLRIPHGLYSRLQLAARVWASRTAALYPQKPLYFCLWYSLTSEAE